MAVKKNAVSGKEFPGKWLLKHIIAAVVVVIVLVVGAIIFLEIATKHGQELIVPDLSNMTIEEASQMAQSRQMVVDVTDSVYVKRIDRKSVV